MRTALHRSGEGGADFNRTNSTHAHASHPDLVAYWTFDSDQGYEIKDISNHSHDLYALTEPNYQVRALLPFQALLRLDIRISQWWSLMPNLSMNWDTYC